MQIDPMRRAWMEVDCRALRANYGTVTKRIPAGCAVLPMVKANGYGVGASLAIRTLRPLDPWGFGVATTEEGLEVRANGWNGPIVVFTPTMPADVPDMLMGGMEPVISSLGALDQFAATGGDAVLTMHLEVDTGMGRFGFDWSKADAWVAGLADRVAGGRLRLGSTFTHFHSAESDREATLEQWRRLSTVVEAMREAGIDPGLVHAANSAAILEYTGVADGVAGDMVRPGVWLYGVELCGRRASVVASVRARVLEVRDVPAGTSVSYGATYRTPGPARLATLGIGYADGYPRTLSGRGRVLIGGRPAPVRGIVSMDSIVVDVTGRDEVRRGDVATVLGTDGDEEITVEELAEACDTISYEILTGWSARLPRIGFDGDA